MKVLFLSLIDFESVRERNIYTDLLREFMKNDHEVYIVSPMERRKKKETYKIKEKIFFGEGKGSCTILKVKIGNTQKTNIVEKGISTLLIEGQCKRAIQKYFKNISFDLVLYATPPITFARVVGWIKKRDGAATYLMLKDIFPQNAADLRMFSKKGLFYRYFRRKEKKLYRFSDHIGCMSPANVRYVRKHNPEVEKNKVEVCPNSIEVTDILPESGHKNKADGLCRQDIRKKYGIPEDKIIFLYGGNLGKPQDVPYIIRCIERCRKNKDAFFVVCGTGTEYERLKAYKKRGAENLCLIHGLPKEEYEQMAGACDVGLIFLDHRFTIPNFPSRLLSYMEHGMMVLSATDPNTDVGDVIREGNFGYSCESNSTKAFYRMVKRVTDHREQIGFMGDNARSYLLEHYTVKKSYQTIMKHDKAKKGEKKGCMQNV